MLKDKSITQSPVPLTPESYARTVNLVGGTIGPALREALAIAWKAGYDAAVKYHIDMTFEFNLDED